MIVWKSNVPEAINLTIEAWAPADIEQVTSDYEPHTIEMSAHVKECMEAGPTSLAGLNNDLESLYDGHTVCKTLQHHHPLFQVLLQSISRTRSVATLPPVPSSAEINLSHLVKS